MSRDSTSVLIRMRDVGLALHAAASYERALSRIHLQKYLYLMDSLAGLYQLLPPIEAHYTFRHGPYDPFIQSAVDSLAFRGLARISTLVRRSNGNIAAEYSLSSAGRRWSERMRSHAALTDRMEVAEAVARQVNRIGWDRLVPLVYAEPTYLSGRAAGFGKKLKPQRSSTNSSAYVLQLIKQALPVRSPLVTREVIAEYYFDYLEAYARGQRSVVSEDLA
jgi:hypothetical protein